MSDLKAKMHQNRFRLGLCPRPNWRAYSAPPNPIAGFKGPTSKGKGRWRKGDERGGDDPHLSLVCPPPLEWLIRSCTQHMEFMSLGQKMLTLLFVWISHWKHRSIFCLFVQLIIMTVQYISVLTKSSFFGVFKLLFRLSLFVHCSVS